VFGRGERGVVALAAASGVSRNTIRAIERGGHKPSLRTAEKLAAAMKIELVALI
jgi:DNA-binding XRE family transcriptional regulator